MSNVSKNRAAADLMQQADTIFGQISDVNSKMTAEEVEKATSEIKTLRNRAAAIDALYIEKATGEVVAVDAQADQEEKVVVKAASPEGLAQLNKEILAAFGGHSEYIQKCAVVAKGGIGGLTKKQQDVFVKVKEVTKAINGNSGDTSGGEFVLPLQQADTIFRVSNLQKGILDKARTFNVAGRSLRIPQVLQTTGSNTRPVSSISAISIVGEGTSIGAANPQFTQTVLNVYKYAGFTQIGNETLQDDFTGQVPQALMEMVGGECVNAINADCTIFGSGSAAPLGALNGANGSLITQTRASGSAIYAADVFGMFQKHTQGPNSFWLVSRTAVASLMTLTLNANTLVTYLPNLNNNPAGAQLLGFPVIVSDFLPALGTQADLALVDPDFYAVGLRKVMTVESSTDFAFQTDQMSYRFSTRGGGVPLLTSTLAYISTAGTKANAYSPFVALK